MNDGSKAGPTGVGRYRWRVCAMLLLATTINYIDRQVLGVLAPLLQTEIGWNQIEYGSIVTASQALQQRMVEMIFCKQSAEKKVFTFAESMAFLSSGSLPDDEPTTRKPRQLPALFSCGHSDLRVPPI